MDANFEDFYLRARVIDPLLADALKDVVLNDPRPYEGITTKLASKSGRSRAEVCHFLKKLRQLPDFKDTI